MSEWRDFSTAPKEGVFLVWMPKAMNGSHVQAMKRHPNVSIIGGQFAFDLSKPTHWMPLPAPPEPTT